MARKRNDILAWKAQLPYILTASVEKRRKPERSITRMLPTIQGRSSRASMETESVRKPMPTRRMFSTSIEPPRMARASRWKISTNGKAQTESRIAWPKKEALHHSQKASNPSLRTLMVGVASRRWQVVGDAAACGNDADPEDQRDRAGQFDLPGGARSGVPLVDATAEGGVEHDDVQGRQHQHDHLYLEEERAVEVRRVG